MPFISEQQMLQTQLLKTIIFFLIIWLTCHVTDKRRQDESKWHEQVPMHNPQPSEKSSLHCPVKTLVVYSSRQPGLVSTTCTAHASSGHILTDRQHYQAIFGKQEDHTDECVSAETFKTCLLPCLESCVATVWCCESSKYTL